MFAFANCQNVPTKHEKETIFKENLKKITSKKDSLKNAKTAIVEAEVEVVDTIVVPKGKFKPFKTNAHASYSNRLDRSVCRRRTHRVRIASSPRSMPVNASASVVNRSSAIPCASLARQFAVAGAMTNTSARRAKPMCSPMKCSTGANVPRGTGRPVRASNVVAPMNRRAERVITTETPAPA